MQNKKYDIDELWISYKDNKNHEEKKSIILHYLSLIKYAMSKMVLPVNTILSENDFINFGVLGLSEAIDRFDINRGIKFESYAIKRIKGKIQDELRKLDWMSRSARKKASEFKSISDTLSLKQEKGFSEAEVLKELNITPEKYRSYLIAASDAKSSVLISDSSFNTISDEDDEVNFLENIADESQDFIEDIFENEKQKLLSQAITELKENKRIVLTLYYFENLNFKEIGQVLGVSESRISQIHSETIKELQSKMRKYEYV